MDPRSARRLAVVLAAIRLAAATTPAHAQDAPPAPPAPPPAEGTDAAGGVEAGVDEEVPVEAPAPEDAPAEDRTAPHRSATGVDGLVLDAESREGVVEGTVRVVDRDLRVTTDLEGRFSLDLPPGRYVLRAFADLHRSVRVSPVIVGRRRRSRLRILLPGDLGLMDEVVVTAEADTASATGQIVARRQSATVRDAVSAQEIARAADSTASAAVRRVVGATVVDGQYLYVRGLGGRYTTVLLNGVPLPATDPDVIGVQLDLIPAALLTSLAIQKTFSADMPGDVAGGVMQISTRDLPSRLTLSANLTLGGSTLTTFRDAYGYRGGGLDWLGLDDGTRHLPGSVPRRPLSELGAQERTAVARDFPDIWALTTDTALPDVSLGLTAGSRVSLGGPRRLAFLAALSYSRSTEIRTERLAETTSSQPDANAPPVVALTRDDLEQNVGRESVLWGLLGSAGLTLSPHHELRALTFLSQAGQDSASFLQGFSEDDGERIAARRLRWLQRQLWFNQLLGEHSGLPGGSSFRWQGFVSLGDRYEPDTRTLFYEELRGSYIWADGPNSGERFYSDLDQIDYGGSGDYTLPLGTVTARAGGGVRLSERNFEARRFLYVPGRLPGSDRSRAPEDLFADEGIGTLVQLQERTRPDDSYASTQGTYAAYLMLDVPLSSRLRLVGGARAEAFRQVVDDRSPFSDTTAEVLSTRRTDLDLLPSASAVIDLGRDMDVRLGYAGTVARPQIRELVPLLYFDFVRRRSLQGNPDLQRTYIHNFDVRWEWFLGEDEVLAVSGFYKQFHDAIEPRVQDPRTGNLSFANAESATNLGTELELRLSLGRIAPALRSLSFGANLTLVHSSVQLSEQDARFAYSQERPLAGQSPFVVNLSLGFSPPGTGLSVFLYYNAYGRRIQDVGSRIPDGDGSPDVYEEAGHLLDLVATWEVSSHLSLRATAKNLLGQGYTLREGPFTIRDHSLGTSFALRAAWTY